jgi:hypothetical protein
MKKSIGKRIVGLILVMLALAIVWVSFMGASCTEFLMGSLFKWSCVNSGCWTVSGPDKTLQCSQSPGCNTPVIPT